MPALDFKEIPTPSGGAERDRFELFAREFLVFKGFRILEGPDRGQDGGRDLIVEEIRTGVAGETRIRWLVSCKHKAHSGASVTQEDERDVHDRVSTHGCQGFLGFYSTVPSSGLALKLNARGIPYETDHFDSERIERDLLHLPSGLALAKRFFPVSVQRWQKEHPKPARLWDEEPALTCSYCHKDLLAPTPDGIVVIWHTVSSGEDESVQSVEDLYCCCKGMCDRALQSGREGLVDAWEDITSLTNPSGFVRWWLWVLGLWGSRIAFSDTAVRGFRYVFANVFPYVCREMTESETEWLRRRLE